MAGTNFSHPEIGTLPIRFAPTSVEWDFNLVTNTVPTYAGEVVQVLAINFNRLTIEGQFGKEGVWGAVQSGGKLNKRPVSEYRDFKRAGTLGIGLTQMTEFFQRYFAIASQGHDARVEGHYNQQPMTLTYDGASDIGIELDRGESWQVYPVNFPSYSRSVEDFAPKWRVECQIHEAPASISTVTQKDVVSQLNSTDKDAFRPGVGYRPFNPFSDPFEGTAGFSRNARDFDNLSPSQRLALLSEARKEANENADKLYDKWRSMLPAYDDDTLNRLILIGGSMPSLDDETTKTPTKTPIKGNHGGSGDA